MVESKQMMDMLPSIQISIIHDKRNDAISMELRQILQSANNNNQSKSLKRKETSNGSKMKTIIEPVKITETTVNNSIVFASSISFIDYRKITEATISSKTAPISSVISPSAPPVIVAAHSTEISILTEITIKNVNILSTTISSLEPTQETTTATTKIITNQSLPETDFSSTRLTLLFSTKYLLLKPRLLLLLILIHAKDKECILQKIFLPSAPQSLTTARKNMFINSIQILGTEIKQKIRLSTVLLEETISSSTKSITLRMNYVVPPSGILLESIIKERPTQRFQTSALAKTKSSFISPKEKQTKKIPIKKGAKQKGVPSLSLTTTIREKQYLKSLSRLPKQLLISRIKTSKQEQLSLRVSLLSSPIRKKQYLRSSSQLSMQSLISSRSTSKQKQLLLKVYLLSLRIKEKQHLKSPSRPQKQSLISTRRSSKQKQLSLKVSLLPSPMREHIHLKSSSELQTRSFISSRITSRQRQLSSTRQTQLSSKATILSSQLESSSQIQNQPLLSSRISSKQRQLSLLVPLLSATRLVSPSRTSESCHRPPWVGKILVTVLFYAALLIPPLSACSKQPTARSSRDYHPLPTEDQIKINVLNTEMKDWIKQPYQNSSNIPKNLNEVVSALNGSPEEGNNSNPDRIFPGGNGRCSACRILTKFVIGYLRAGGPIDPMSNLMITICYLAFYRSKTVCKGIINEEQETLAYIAKNSPLTGDQLCAMVLSSSGQSPSSQCGMFRGPRWTVPLPLPLSNKKHSKRHLSHLTSINTDTKNDAISKPLRSLRNGDIDSFTGDSSKQRFSVTYFNNRHYRDFKDQFNNGLHYLKVLHLTDIHFDPNYKAGSSAVCDAPLCCTRESGPPRHPGEAAGKWGDYRNCDTPRRLVENMMSHIRQHHSDIDYIMWTGDSVPHDLWKITRRGNSHVISEVARMIHKYFPGVPVYGAIGNHESFPRDSFPPPEVPLVWRRFGVQWLYDLVVNQWQSFVPSSTIAPSARFAGCYAMTVRPGFKIISINTNYCYKFNWWTLFKSVDPGHVLRWLVSELLEAESKGEYVHIIGHIAPLYEDCYEEWGHQFSRIVTRFSPIIRGQFYGHCHRDEVKLHFDVRETKLPVGVEYLTPNNGPYKGLNPSFRLYYVDGDHKDTNRAVIDYETYYMNLTSANHYGDARWQLLYRAKRDLGLQSLEPKDWDNFAHRMARDPELANKYYKYNVQGSDLQLFKGCDSECRYGLICSIVDGDKFMPRKCRPPDS